MKPSQKAELYKKYLWPKCSKSTFYERMKRWIEFTEAIKPVEYEVRYRPGKIKSRKFESELEWYKNYEWMKPSRARFYQRLYQWWSKEEAIMLKVPKKHFFKEIKVNKNPYVKSKTPLLKKVDDSDKYEIRIRYSREEADVIRKEYINMIDDLEWKLHWIEDLQEAKEVNNRLEKLKKEYEIFRNSNS